MGQGNLLWLHLGFARRYWETGQDTTAIDFDVANYGCRPTEPSDTAYEKRLFSTFPRSEQSLALLSVMALRQCS